MTNARSDGRIFLALGILCFILFGVFFEYHAADSTLDFQEVYCGARLFAQHHDPYDPAWMSNIYSKQFGESEFVEHHKGMIFLVYFPTGLLVLAPLGALPWQIALILWNVLILGGLIAAACLMWQIGADYAPVLTGGLVGFALANAAVVFANGNPAGVVVGLTVIAAWCIIQERLVWFGILCLVVSLAIKPQDAGLIWLFFLLQPAFRKRAIQTAAIMALLWAAAALWTWHVAPHWLPEFHSNFTYWAGHGANSDPGPTGLTSKTGTMEVITSLQTVISIFRNSPPFYNAVTYLFCGLLLIVWAVTTIKSTPSPILTWTALATVTPLTLLVTYHRAYDARLLLLSIPACAMLWAKGGPKGKIALAVTFVALFFTGEIPLAFIAPHIKHLNLVNAGVFAKLGMLPLARPATLSLVAMSLFYLCIYVRESRSAPAPQTPA